MYGLLDTYADVHKILSYEILEFSERKIRDCSQSIAGETVMHRALSWQQSHKGFSLQFDSLLQGSH